MVIPFPIPNQQIVDYYKNMMANGEGPAGIAPVIGQMFYYGARGTPQDFQEAASLFQAAAEEVRVALLGFTVPSAPEAGCTVGRRLHQLLSLLCVYRVSFVYGFFVRVRVRVAG